MANRSPAITGRDWTSKDDERLAMLWRKGVHLKQIAFDIDRSYEATKQRRYILKLMRRNRGLGETRKVVMSLDVKTYNLMCCRAMERGQNITNYIRYLIQVNVGTAT